MKLATGALLLALVSSTAWAQVNAGDQKPEASVPFNMTTVATFTLPWRMAFLPDGRMLVTEKVGPVWLVTQQGQKTLVANTPPVYWQGQNGMLGVYVSPTYATDQRIYLTYAEPGDYGGGLALARARLNVTPTGTNLQNVEVLWRQLPRGRGGQEGAAVAFAPDGQSLFLTVGDRQRFTPAQDPDQPVGKILHLTLGRKTCSGQSPLREDRRRHHFPDRSAHRHRSRQDREGGEHLYLPWSEQHAGGNVDHGPPHALRHGVLADR